MNKLFNKFMSDKSGNVGMILAICLMPLMGFVGFAVDYNNASRQKAILQSASDMAALYIAKLKDPEKKAKAQQIAQDMVTQLAKEAKIKNLKINGSIANKTVSVTAEANSPNAFSQIFGFQDVKVGVLAQAIYAAPKIEVGLVLDNSGSMGMRGAKGINSLIPATINLLTLFEGMKEDAEQLVKVSFTTFDHTVLYSESLSQDFSKMKTLASEMYPQGGTNVGQAMRASHEQLKKGEAKIRKFMIVLTDGKEEASGNEHLWMPISCPKIRQDASVTIYTIGLGPASYMEPAKLAECAGSEKRFFLVEDQSKLDETFKKIFDEISGLRLTN